MVKYYADDPGYFFLLGSAYAHVGNGDKALECAQKGLALHPKDNNLVGNLQWVRGRAYIILKQYDAAIAAAQSAIAAQPQDFNNYLLLAQADFSEKRYDQVITAAKRSVELKPSPNGYLLAAASFWKKNDPDTALRVARKGLALAPQNPDLLMLVGRLNTEKLDFDASLEAYSKAEAVHAKDSAVSVQYALYFGGKYDEALSRCLKTVQDAEDGRVGVTLMTIPQGPPAVATVVPNSPASEAGLLPGDWICEVDGQKTYKGAFHITPLMTAEEVVSKLKGPPGSSVTLKILRPGKILRFDKTLVRKTMVFSDEANEFALESLCYIEKK
ncbi:MAG: PDZ domain-containing protein, partial [Acidobacteriota bacterium]